MQGEMKHQFIECAKQLQHLSPGESDRRSLNNLVMGPQKFTAGRTINLNGIDQGPFDSPIVKSYTP